MPYNKANKCVTNLTKFPKVYQMENLIEKEDIYEYEGNCENKRWF